MQADDKSALTFLVFCLILLTQYPEAKKNYIDYLLVTLLIFLKNNGQLCNLLLKILHADVKRQNDNNR